MSLMTGDELAVPACRIHRRQTGSYLAIQLDSAAVESVAAPSCPVSMASSFFNFHAAYIGQRETRSIGVPLSPAACPTWQVRC